MAQIAQLAGQLGEMMKTGEQGKPALDNMNPEQLAFFLEQQKLSEGKGGAGAGSLVKGMRQLTGKNIVTDY